MSNYSIEEIGRQIDNCRNKEEIKDLLYKLRNEIADDDEGEAMKQKILRLRGRY